MSGQMLELGHSQIGDGDEVGGGTEAARSAFGLLEQAVHGLDAMEATSSLEMNGASTPSM